MLNYMPFSGFTTQEKTHKKIYFVDTHPKNVPVKKDFKWFSGFPE
jgi:hypothetical protein